MKKVIIAAMFFLTGGQAFAVDCADFQQMTISAAASRDHGMTQEQTTHSLKLSFKDKELQDRAEGVTAAVYKHPEADPTTLGTLMRIACLNAEGNK
jgi:ribosomal 50S subunit-associated protein YjgA (DUF615 family)